MKTISNELTAHLAQEVTTLAHCWKLTRRDNVVMGFTSHDKDLIISGVTYAAATGFTPTAISGSSSLAVDNLDIEGMLSSGAISEDDILAGIYDFAEIELFLVNYEDLSQGIMKLRRGWLGEVKLSGQQFVAEVRGLTQRLSQQTGELYSPSCRAELGDSRCKVNLATYTVTGSVTSVTSQQIFVDSSRSEAADTYAFGKITFTGGANNGLSMEVKEFANSQLVLALPMPYAITVGDTYSLIRGCDKTLDTCENIFANAVNFRGEPHVPGIDRVLETAGTLSE